MVTPGHRADTALEDRGRSRRRVTPVLTVILVAVKSETVALSHVFK